MIKYKKTQYGFLLSSIFILVMLGILIAYILQLGERPIPLALFIILFSLFLVIIVIFHKLTITINEKDLLVSFGFGILKKKLTINDIETIQKIKMPWYYGIGIRLTPKGWLWNVKFGEAIYIKTKNNKTFLFGTNDGNSIIKILKTS